MFDYEMLKEKAMECGFSNVGLLDADTIEIKIEARDACAENKCNNYNKNWSCPPGCGSLEECSKMIHKYKYGLILQTTGKIDSFDYESWTNLANDHKKHMDEFAEYIRANYMDAMIMGASACAGCKECTFPYEPCRFPEKLSHPMEGLGMIVSEVCQANNIKYYYGAGTLTYVGAVLVE